MRGLVDSDGRLKSAVHGGISGAVFGAVEGFGRESGWNSGSLANNTKFAAAHAAGGCVTSVASGGKCGSGAMAAGFSKFATQAYSFENDVADGIKATVVGGTASVIGGGKFENGAMTAAYGYLFNYCMSKGCFESDAEMALRLSGKIEGYWSLKCAGNESYGCQALDMATGSSYLARLTRTRLYGFYIEGGGKMNEGDFFGSVRSNLMNAYGVSQRATSSLINPQWLSVREITVQHWDVFGGYNIPPQAFGGTPFANYGQQNAWFARDYGVMRIFGGSSAGWCGSSCKRD